MSSQKAMVAQGGGKEPRCPICRRLATVDYHPFCSLRCANVDLGRWLGEVYSIEAQGEPEGQDELESKEDGLEPQ